MKRLVQIDMNLLVALDALLAERSVTRAAKLLGVSQPAVSQKLKRLRDELDDPLLVSGPRGLSPTPRAQAIAQPLRSLLHELADVVLGEAAFDPTTAERRFVVAGSDLFELANMPRILEMLGRMAPGVRVDSVPRSADIFDRLERGSVDFVFGPSPMERAGLHRAKLEHDSFVVVARPNHPLMRGRLTLKKYLAARHVVVSPGGQPGTFVDRALEAMGERRRIMCQVASFSAVPYIVLRHDYFGTVPSVLARAVGPHVDLAMRKLPFHVPPVDAYMIWHERFERDPGHRWFREQAKALATAAKHEG